MKKRLPPNIDRKKSPKQLLAFENLMVRPLMTGNNYNMLVYQQLNLEVGGGVVPCWLGSNFQFTRSLVGNKLKILSTNASKLLSFSTIIVYALQKGLMPGLMRSLKDEKFPLNKCSLFFKQNPRGQIFHQKNPHLFFVSSNVPIGSKRIPCPCINCYCQSLVYQQNRKQLWNYGI